MYEVKGECANVQIDKYNKICALAGKLVESKSRDTICSTNFY